MENGTIFATKVRKDVSVWGYPIEMGCAVYSGEYQGDKQLMFTSETIPDASRLSQRK